MILSVIIPVFNGGQDLEKCLLSLLIQTYQAFEIILVDDGSTDASRQKAEALLARRADSVILSQRNQGASSARNAGIRVARGEWLTFVDCDDYLAPDYLDHLMRQSGGCDLLVSGIVFMKGGKEDHRTLPPNETCNITDLKQGKGGYLDHLISPVGKLYRREIIDRDQLRFDETFVTAEDRDFNLEYLSHAATIRFIPYAGYYYQTDHEGSLSKRPSLNGLRSDILYWNKLYRLLDGTNDAYLAHRLFYFLVDNAAALLQRKDYSGTFHSLMDVRPLIDRSFLRRNLNIVQAPAWQKTFIRFYLG